MKFLPAPWRWDFITKKVKNEGCVFCDNLKKNDRDALICHKGKDFFIILNKYPYNTAHLMIVPYAHVDTPGKILPQQSVEMWELMTRSMAILDEHFHPHGFNIGMNIGQAAGAGIKDHFHLHIVPRWEGDANFMPVVGETRVLSYDFETIFNTLYNAFKQ